jgi:hypothetical protein
MFILTIESDTKENLTADMESIKKLIEQGYLEGIDFETHWELKQED